LYLLLFYSFSPIYSLLVLFFVNTITSPFIPSLLDDWAFDFVLKISLNVSILLFFKLIKNVLSILCYKDIFKKAALGFFLFSLMQYFVFIWSFLLFLSAFKLSQIFRNVKINLSTFLLFIFLWLFTWFLLFIQTTFLFL
jgi:hypothetical protein